MPVSQSSNHTRVLIFFLFSLKIPGDLCPVANVSLHFLLPSSESLPQLIHGTTQVLRICVGNHVTFAILRVFGRLPVQLRTTNAKSERKGQTALVKYLMLICKAVNPNMVGFIRTYESDTLNFERLEKFLVPKVKGR